MFYYQIFLFVYGADALIFFNKNMINSKATYELKFFA